MITEPSKTSRASIPTVRVKRLHGTFERDHRGPRERPRAIAEIEAIAALTRARDLANLSASQRPVLNRQRGAGE